jgi:hypothetical protein
MTASQRALALAWSDPVGGNHDGKALGRISMTEPMAANTRAFRAFIGVILGNNRRFRVPVSAHNKPAPCQSESIVPSNYNPLPYLMLLTTGITVFPQNA